MGYKLKTGIRLSILAIISLGNLINLGASNTESPLVEFGINQLVQSGFIESPQESSKIKMRISAELGEQSYRIQQHDSSEDLEIEGGDERGLMYAFLELAEQHELFGEHMVVNGRKGTPFIKNRGLKFNIPLDARCPSYDDTGDSAQKNIEHMWDFTFWSEFFDRMATHRYNTLTLWSPNPFPVMIKLEDYPNIALDNVYVTTAIPNGRVGEWSDAGGVNEVVLKNLRRIKSISIDEKIAFWQKVFQYGKDRGIDIYFITWNIYTNGTYGKYGLSDEFDNPANIPFYRKATKTFLETYPQIKGLGVTAGERMHVPAGRDVNDERERWLWDTYGKGILDYTAEYPDREIPFIHRFWYSKFDKIWKYWKDYPHHLDFSLKYITARIYSSPERSPYYETIAAHLKEHEVKSWWNLRNDDIFVYRWGDPDYVREFLKNLPHLHTAGYHMGSDGYVWGRVFSDKRPLSANQLELDKHWYKFMLWGRLGYDNSLDRSFFERKLKHRFQIPNAAKLYEAWQSASRIVPQINRYMFYTGDRHWTPEGCFARESFRFVPDFRVTTALRSTDILNPRTFVRQSIQGTLPGSFTSPVTVSENLAQQADEALRILEEIQSASNSPELNRTLDDIEAMSWLGKYYSFKIASATALEWFDQSGGKKEHANEAIDQIDEAARAWKHYANVSEKNYHSQMLSRVNTLDWSLLGIQVEHDRNIVHQIVNNYGKLPSNNNQDDRLKITYPYKGVTKRFGLTLPSTGSFVIELYEGASMVGYYVNDATNATDSYAWEDLQKLAKGNYTLNLKFEGENTTLKFTR